MIAVLFYGLMWRSLQWTHQSIAESLLAPLVSRYGGAEVFYHSWEMERIHNPCRGEMQSYQRVGPEPEAWPCPVHGVYEPQSIADEIYSGWVRKLDATTSHYHQYFGSDLGELAVLNLFRALESKSRVWKLMEASGRSYDAYAIARPDCLYKLTLGNVTDAITVPDFAHWGGENDRFAITQSKDAAEHYCSQASYPEIYTQGGLVNSERFLAEHLSSRPVVRDSGILLKRVRANGIICPEDTDLF